MVECLKAHDYVNGFIVINDYREVNLMDVMTKMNLSELQQFMTILIVSYIKVVALIKIGSLP